MCYLELSVQKQAISLSSCTMVLILCSVFRSAPNSEFEVDRSFVSVFFLPNQNLNKNSKCLTISNLCSIYNEKQK